MKISSLTLSTGVILTSLALAIFILLEIYAPFKTG